MAQDVESSVGFAEDRLDAAVCVEDVREVALDSVNDGGDGSGLASVDILDDLSSGDAAGVFMRVISADLDCDHRHWQCLRRLRRRGVDMKGLANNPLIRW